MFTLHCVVNYVGHTIYIYIYEEINTKNIMDIVVGMLFPNSQYITLETHIVDYNISIG